MLNTMFKIASLRIAMMIEKVKVLGIKIEAFFELILPFIVGALVFGAIYGVMFLMMIACGCAY